MARITSLRPGAKAAAGDDGAFGFAGIEIQILTRPRFFKKQGLMGIDVLIVFMAQAQHHLSGIDHVPVRKRRGILAWLSVAMGISRTGMLYSDVMAILRTDFFEMLAGEAACQDAARLRAH